MITPELAAALQKVNEMSPEEKDKLFAELPYEVLEALAENVALPQKAREDSPAGYAAFYRLHYGFDPPRHVMEDMVIPLYEGKKLDKGTLLWLFRGSWKTTSTTVTFGAFRMGLEPHKSNLVVMAGDSSANKAAAAIANIVENSAAFALAFPHVKPYKEKSWGADSGYEIISTRWPFSLKTGKAVKWEEVDLVEHDKVEWREITPEQWNDFNSARVDPSLLSGGYKSRTVLGKHPSGFLFFDDVMDRTNTDSIRELDAAVDTILGTILPTKIRIESRPEGKQLVTWTCFVGTPWVEDDIYHLVRDTGEYVFSKRAAMERVTEHTPEAVWFEVGDKDIDGWYLITWPERMGLNALKAAFHEVGKRKFSQMYLLDLHMAEQDGIKFHTFPHELIKPQEWLGGAGCDYMSVMKEKRKDLKHRSFFALYDIFKIPGGGLVVYDGVCTRPSQLEAEGHIKARQVLYPHWRGTALEIDGKGEEGYQTFMRNPGVKIVPVTTKGIPKTSRHEMGLIPYIENGTLRVSDGDSVALQMLRKSLRKWHHWILDPEDALEHALKLFPEELVHADVSKGLPNMRSGTQVQTHPFATF